MKEKIEKLIAEQDSKITFFNKKIANLKGPLEEEERKMSNEALGLMMENKIWLIRVDGAFEAKSNLESLLDYI